MEEWNLECNMECTHSNTKEPTMWARPLFMDTPTTINMLMVVQMFYDLAL